MGFTSDADSLFPLGGFGTEPDESDFTDDFITYDPVKTRLQESKAGTDGKPRAAHRNDLYCRWFINSSTSASESNNLIVQP